MQNPTVPPPGEGWPSDPPPTLKQDHAVLAWLALEADLPDTVQLHLLDALAAWAPLMGPHLFPSEPGAGGDCDLRQVLEAMWWRRSEQALDAPWADKIALNEVCDRLGLALAEMRASALRCQHLGYREAEGGRLTWLLVGRYGVVGNPVVRALVTSGETATEAVVARRTHSAVSCGAARRAAWA